MDLNSAQSFVNNICSAYHLKPLQIKVVNLPQLNAKLCSSRNIIRVTTYDLDTLPNEQMEALLSHEIAHKLIYRKHSIHISWLLFIALAASVYFGKAIRLIIILCIVSFILYILLRDYILRHNEYKADYIGTKLSGSINMFSLLNTAIRTGGMEKHSGIFSKHPSLNKRKKHLEKFF